MELEEVSNDNIQKGFHVAVVKMLPTATSDISNRAFLRGWKEELSGKLLQTLGPRKISPLYILMATWKECTVS